MDKIRFVQGQMAAPARGIIHVHGFAVRGERRVDPVAVFQSCGSVLAPARLPFCITKILARSALTFMPSGPLTTLPEASVYGVVDRHDQDRTIRKTFVFLRFRPDRIDIEIADMLGFLHSLQKGGKRLIFRMES